MNVYQARTIFNDEAKVPIETKVRQAIHSYQRAYGDTNPACVLVNPLWAQCLQVDGIPVRISRPGECVIGPHYFMALGDRSDCP